MRNENIPSNDQKTLTACLAKNEGEGMQFVLNFDQDASNVSLSMTDFINEKGEILAAEAYRQYYISVEKNAGYANHGYYPDAMIPLKYDDLNSVDIKAGENQGYWITVTSTEEQTAGIYTGEVTLTHDGGIIKIPVEIEVWDFALPVERSFETAYAIWNNAYNLMQKNNALNGQSYYDVWEQYYWFFQEYRITGTHLPIPFNNVDQYANDILRFASDPRVTSYNISALGNYTIENGVAVPTSATKALLDRMRADGTLEKAYIYMFDEIGDGTASQKETLAAINSYAPDLRVMTTSSPREPLADYIDLFCGIWSSETTAFERYVRDWQQRGYEVWWYGCTAPRAPYPTFHVQDRLMSSRLVRWMQKD